MPLKEQFKHFAEGLTLLECPKCKRAYYWSKKALENRPLKCWWCKGEIRVEP